MPTPAHLARPAGAAPLVNAFPAVPRIIVVTPMSALASQHAAGSVVLDDGRPVGEAVALVGMSHYWAMYPEYQEGASNKPHWTAEYGSDAANRPECRWNGDEKPAAAEAYRLVFWGPSIDLRVMTCQRSMVKPVKAMLTEIDSYGCVVFGPRWTIGSMRTGKLILPTFTQAGWTTEAEAAEIAALAEAIEHLAAIPQ